MRGLSNRNVFPPGFGGWTFQTELLAGLVPPEACEGRGAPFLTCRWPYPSASLHHLFSVQVCVQISSSYKDPVLWVTVHPDGLLSA